MQEPMVQDYTVQWIQLQIFLQKEPSTSVIELSIVEMSTKKNKRK